MTRSDKHPVGRVVAKTEAKVDASLTSRQAYEVKSGAWKSGNDRFEPAKKSADVTVHRRG
jgi:alkyl hydroperoxide reductase subunit AhpC